jgi:hypothetical protein
MENKDFVLERKKHRLLRISSEDKARGTNSRFSVDIPPTAKSIDNVCGYSVKYAAIPNIFYNVPSYANTLQVIRQAGPVVYDVVITPNQYNISDLIVELEAKINAVIFPDTLTITLTSQGKLNFLFNPNNFSLNYANSSISQIIGLAADTPFFTNLTLSNPVNLLGETEVYIHSRALHQSGLTETNGNFSVVDVIPLSNTPYGGVSSIVYPNNQLSKINFQPYETNKSLRTIDITLRNRTGQILDLPSNFNFTLLLKLYHD